jgi:hypothetical protein
MHSCLYSAYEKFFIGSTSYIYRVSLSLCSYGNKYPFFFFFLFYLETDQLHTKGNNNTAVFKKIAARYRMFTKDKLNLFSFSRTWEEHWAVVQLTVRVSRVQIGAHNAGWTQKNPKTGMEVGIIGTVSNKNFRSRVTKAYSFIATAWTCSNCLTQCCESGMFIPDPYF